MFIFKKSGQVFGITLSKKTWKLKKKKITHNKKIIYSMHGWKAFKNLPWTYGRSITCWERHHIHSTLSNSVLSTRSSVLTSEKYLHYTITEPSPNCSLPLWGKHSQGFWLTLVTPFNGEAKELLISEAWMFPFVDNQTLWSYIWLMIFFLLYNFTYLSYGHW